MLLNLSNCNTLDDVQQQAEGQIEIFFGLMQLGEVDFSTLLGCGIQLLVTVSVCEPHHLEKNKNRKKI